MSGETATRLPTLRDLLARAHVRLILFSVLLATVSLVLSGGLVIRSYAKRNMELMARTVAYTVEPAVIFEDNNAIREGMVSVTAGRGIGRIEVRDQRGQLLAEWHDPDAGGLTILTKTLNGWLWPRPATSKVYRGGSTIAEVRIFGDSEALLRYLLAGTIIALSSMGLTILGSRILARRLQNHVVRPLEHVAAVAHAVRTDRAFDRRVPASGIDDIDRFGQDFNALLAELQGWHAGITAENRELEWRANHDRLTGLGNRDLFETMVAKAIEQSPHTGQGFAVLFLDLDRFKNINDRLGHHTGDAVLIAVADRLRGAVRRQDLVFRMGGDEFAVLLSPLRDALHVNLVIDRIRTEMNRPFMLPCGTASTSDLSIGIALYPDHGKTIEALLRKADEEMYRDKRGGKEAGVQLDA